MLKDIILKLVDWILDMELKLDSFVGIPQDEWDDEEKTDYEDSFYLYNILGEKLMLLTRNED